MAKPSVKDPKQICTELLGQAITEIEVDYDKEQVTIYTHTGLIEFTGDGLVMYVENNPLDS